MTVATTARAHAAAPSAGPEPRQRRRMHVCRRAAGSQTVTHVTVRIVAPAAGGAAQGQPPPLAPALWSGGPPDEEELESMRLPRQKLELLGANPLLPVLMLMPADALTEPASLTLRRHPLACTMAIFAARSSARSR